MEAHNNKRIAKNTAFLYTGMIVRMFVAFYTSRLVLDALGVDDFGIYNVVGGAAVMFVFFSSSLTNATQRYLNYEMATGTPERVRQIFNQNFLIYAAICLLTLLVGGIIGNWLVEDVLVIGAGRIEAAKAVLWASLFSLIFSLMGSVYESVLVARENMKAFAYVNVFEALLRLGVAFSIQFVPADRLICYAIFIALAEVISKSIIILYCRRLYPETRLLWFFDWRLVRELFAFIGWNLYSGAAWMAVEQGFNIFLNLFFGPAVNAARGIALQVNLAVNNFSLNFYKAVQPQIVKTYASRELQQFYTLISSSSRLSFFLLLMLCVPLILRSDYVLQLWLTDVPPYTSQFVEWVLIYSLVFSLNTPLWTAIQAVGHLRATSLYGNTVYLLALPATYVLLKLGFPPYSIFQMLVVVRILYLIIAIRMLNRHVDFPLSSYCRHIVLPILLVSVVSVLPAVIINHFLPDNFGGLVVLCFAYVLILLPTAYFLGVTPQERVYLLSAAQNLLKKLRN